MEHNDSNMEVLSQVAEEDHSEYLKKLIKEPHFETFSSFYNGDGKDRTITLPELAIDTFLFLTQLSTRIEMENRSLAVKQEYPILNFPEAIWDTKDWCRLLYAIGIPINWVAETPTPTCVFSDIRGVNSEESALLVLLGFWMEPVHHAQNYLLQSINKQKNFKQEYCSYVVNVTEVIGDGISFKNWFAYLRMGLARMVIFFLRYIWFVDGGHSVSCLNTVPTLVGHLNNLKSIYDGSEKNGLPNPTKEMISKFVSEDFSKVLPRFVTKTGLVTFFYANGLDHAQRILQAEIEIEREKWDERFQSTLNESIERQIALKQDMPWDQLWSDAMVFVYEMARKHAQEIAWSASKTFELPFPEIPGYNHVWDFVERRYVESKCHWSEVPTKVLITARSMHASFNLLDPNISTSKRLMESILKPFMESVHQKVMILPINPETRFFNFNYIESDPMECPTMAGLCSFRIREDGKKMATLLTVPDLLEFKDCLSFNELIMELRNKNLYLQLKKHFEKQKSNSIKPY